MSAETPIMQNPGDPRIPEDFHPLKRPNTLILLDGATAEDSSDGREVIRLPGSPSTEEEEIATSEATTLYE